MTAVTGSDGRFAIADIRPGPHTVSVQLPGRGRRAANAQRHTLMDTLRRAQMEGELDARTDIESLADFFESTLAGIRIAAKAGKTRPSLRRIAEVASGTFADVKSSVL